MHIREAAQKLAQQVTQERMTGLDRGLLKAADDLVVDVGTIPRQGEYWTRRLDIERLKFLSRMGLARQMSGSRWCLAPEMENTLTALGERGDILKAYHKAMGEDGRGSHDLDSVIFNPDDGATGVTGKVIALGVLNDITDQSYCVLDMTSGRSVLVKMGVSQNIEALQMGDIFEIAPKTFVPKPSDRTIDKISRLNGGVYSLAAHMNQDASARPEFLKAHIRRLEAMRRAGLAKRRKDGTWRVPEYYLEKVTELESRRGKDSPVNARVLVRDSLQSLANTLGRTWLDEQLASADIPLPDKGFGREVRSALQQRRAFLVSSNILETLDQPITKAHLAELERQDIQAAGKNLEDKMGMPFTPPPASGRISGKLVDSIEQPRSRYAVIERAKDFTLVPWRDVLEKRRGIEISGQIRNGQINWQFGRKRGLDIS